jgi:hypothetical protein
MIALKLNAASDVDASFSAIYFYRIRHSLYFTIRIKGIKFLVEHWHQHHRLVRWLSDTEHIQPYLLSFLTIKTELKIAKTFKNVITNIAREVISINLHSFIFLLTPEVCVQRYWRGR